MARGSTREWRAIRQLVLKRDGYRCVYDGAPATHVDHLVPVAAGGTDEMTNLVASCAPCNLKKGSKTLTSTPWVDQRWLERKA